MSKDDSSKIDRFLPDASTVALAQNQAASDAAAERLRADEELRAIVKAQREADEAALRAAPPPAPPSTGQVHIEDAKPNPAPGRVTRPRAYLNLASPDLKRGLPTVKVDRNEAPPAAGLDTIPRVERRWPWAVLVALAVVGAFWLALSLGGPSLSDDTAGSAASPSQAAAPPASGPPRVEPVAPVSATPPVEPPPLVESASATAAPTDNPAHPKTASPPPSQQTAAPVAPPTPPAAPTSPPPQPSTSGKGMTFDFKKGSPQ